jgi:tetratricopeptide (TPR) repeat protein
MSLRGYLTPWVLLFAVLIHSPAYSAPQSFERDRLSKSWKRTGTQEIEVVGPVSDATLREALQAIRSFRELFASLYPGARVTSDVPTRVIVFPDVSALQRFAPRDSRGRQPYVGGYFAPGADLNVIALGGSNRQLVFHEFMHYLVRRNLHSLPTWLNEGLAEVFSTFEIDSKNGTVLVGRPPEDRMRSLRRLRYTPLKNVVEMPPAQMLRLSRDPDGIAMFYAESWGLVHYLQLERGRQTPGAFGRFVQSVERGIAPARALEEVYGTDVSQLDSELQSYLLRRASYPAVSFQLRGSAEEPAPIQRMTEVDARSVQGDLLLRAGAAHEAAEQLADALALDPTNVPARIAAARVQLRLEQPQAVASLKTIAETTPTSFAAAYFLAGALFDERQYSEALTWYSKATHLNQDSAYAWMGLSVTALALGRGSQANAAMARAWTIDSDPAWYSQRAREALGVAADATAASDARHYLEIAGWSSESAVYIGLVGAIAHLRLQQPDGAREMLDAARAACTSLPWTTSVVDFLLGHISQTDLLAKAKTDGEKTEAHAYIGFKAEIEGRQSEALTHFQWVVDKGARNYFEYGMARLELKRLQQ